MELNKGSIVCGRNYVSTDTARKLRPYFLSHSVCVRTNAPLRATLGKAETSGQMVKWAIELSEYDISYQPRSAIKAQALAEFVQEAIFTEGGKSRWLLHMGGSSTLIGSGAGVVLTSPEGDEPRTMAKYEALIAGIKIALDAGAENLIAHTDSS
ncbi:UNVERIFIED_CONTAM: hypothetical protein Slati_0425700 [Sesamum latifolium]|uniref:RNase H type-1 domain-containing protein n=1 Tax=Sesamum latifolium TaxID=2727402 RepID=A0AAW2XWH8_9LAMI